MALLKIHDSISFPTLFWDKYKDMFPKELLDLLLYMHRKFNGSRLKLLDQRKSNQEKYDRGEFPDFLDRNSEAVKSDWKIYPIPDELLCRRVEITGPVNSSKMVINMLNPNHNGVNADMAMLDFEDSMKPTFSNVLEGFKNVIGAVDGNLEETIGDKKYVLDPLNRAYIMVRVRGLHLDESNFRVENNSISAALFDLVTTFYVAGLKIIKKGLTPKYYIPKVEHFLEARWWNDVFTELETKLNLPTPTLRATFLIETLPATFQAEEILFEVRNHAVGMNVGRWDKIFSDIKVLKNHRNCVLPDRITITMDKKWMENYAKRIIKICHDRGAFAIGGMAAFTPGKTSEVRRIQKDKVFNEKKREADWGHDGCWVSHPYFIDVAKEAMKFKNQLEYKIDFDKYSNILPSGEGPHSLGGLRTNVRVGISYMYAWNNDLGCIALDNQMEDLATMEISRAQTWQWLHHRIILDEGIQVSLDLIRQIFNDECSKILGELKSSVDNFAFEDEHKLYFARDTAFHLFTEENLSDFLTTQSEPAY